MPSLKLLLASDLHCSADLAGEMTLAGAQLPTDTYDHMRDGRLVWHNWMLVEQMERMFDALERVVREESPDLMAFVGDLVNTNWPPNVDAVAARINAMVCPTRLVTGNHDIYLDGPRSRLQEVIKPGEYASGMRSEFIGDLGLIYLDLFVQRSDGAWFKSTDSHDPQAAAAYRPEDVSAALALMESRPDVRFLVIGHFPVIAPEERLRAVGRKIGWRWPSGAAIGERLERADNLLGVLCGHQHFAHFQRRSHGFHWMLPALVEYPCAAAIVTVSAQQVAGRLVTPDKELAAKSLSVTNEDWTAGVLSDREFVYVA